MSMSTRSILTSLGIFLAAIALEVTACGGGSVSGDALAQVGGTAITRADLNHWMATLSAGDFYEVSRNHRVPASLVSEPPNYAACVTSLEAAAASARRAQAKTASPATKQSAAQLLTKCRQLYVALRLQTVAYLVNAYWTIGVMGDLGVRASDADVHRLLEEIKTREYPRPGEFERFLAATRRSLADELLVVKLNVLSQKLQQKAHTEGIKPLARKLSEAGRRWTAKTTCRPGNVVPHCRQFRKWRTIAADPAVLLEQVATVTGIPCTNKEGCGLG